MAGIGQFGAWRHAVVGITIVGGSALALAGVIGKPAEPEKYDAKQVVIAPNGAGGINVREVIDQDFGDNDRHGYEQIIDDDFGVPTDITAESPDANAAISVSPDTGSDNGPATRIRLGSASETFTGQHRYILNYTLPSLTLNGDDLFYDVVNPGTDPVTDHFEVVVNGYVLDDPTCATGKNKAAIGTCTLGESGNTYRATLDPLLAGDGLNVGGTVVTTRDVVDVPIPTLPARRSTPSTLPLGLAMIPLGLASGGAVFELARRRGRNEVYAGGAADAAFGPTARPGGPLPPPGSAPAATRLVPDSAMAGLATIEFVPPAGIAPWEGSVLLREKIDDDTVSAWFSGLAARDVLTISKGGEDGKTVVVGKGQKYTAADPSDMPVLAQLFAAGDTVELDGYDTGFATAWRSARAEVEGSIATSGWWKRMPPTSGGCSGQMSAAGADLRRRVPVHHLRLVADRAARRLQGADRRDHLRPRRAGRRRLRRVPHDAAGAQRRGERAGPAHRVVPTLPGRQRGSPRGVGLEAGRAPGVLGVGRRPRHRRHVAAGDGGDERPAGRAEHRPAAAVDDGPQLPLRVHGPVELRRRRRRRQLGWRRWRVLRQRRRRRRRQQLRVVVSRASLRASERGGSVSRAQARQAARRRASATCET